MFSYAFNDAAASRRSISFFRSPEKVPEANEGARVQTNQDCPHPNPLPQAGERK
jgi:hypothetical protein